MACIYKVSAFRCRVWDMHDRAGEAVTITSCKSLIESMRRDGQIRPVLGRALKGNSQYEVELIYGARRLFAAQQIGMDLLVDLREIDDRDALSELDRENRVRSDISPYERGMSYRRWLRAGYFTNQREMARQLGVSMAQISRLLRYSELPATVLAPVTPAHEVRDAREAWVIDLAKAVPG